jgi:outer membrane lipoprotein-sorting protein
VRVRALHQPGKEVVPDRFFWEAADKYDLLVDKERGILLRYAAIVKEKAFAVATVNHATFDEPIPDNVFSFTPESDTIVEIVA